jgi:hypothetical protein
LKLISIVFWMSYGRMTWPFSNSLIESFILVFLFPANKSFVF